MAESRTALRPGLSYRLTLAATLVFVAATLVVVWQLLVLQRELSQRDGENMVWALSQAQHEATVLARFPDIGAQQLKELLRAIAARPARATRRRDAA